MKHITKIISLLLVAVMLTANVSAFSIEADYKDVPPRHWAYEYVMRLGREGIMHGMVEGEYFNKNGEVRSKELLAVLHRMTGEEAYEQVVPIDDIENYYKGEWYRDAVLWAGNNSIILFHYTVYPIGVPSHVTKHGFWGEGKGYNSYLDSENGADSFVDNIGFIAGIIGEGPDTVITRSDVLLAFYRYTTKILEKEVSSKGDISVYTDNKKFPTVKIRPDNDVNFLSENAKFYNDALEMYDGATIDLYDLYGYDALTQIWLWAIDAGIIEGYPDGTLRPDATITRAEFAAMLTRFIDYVK